MTCCQRLRHWIARLRAEFAGHHSVIHVAVGVVKAVRGLSAGERATQIAALDRPGFERAEQLATDATKSRIRRDIVQSNFSCVGNRAYRKDRAAFDGYEHRSLRIGYP